MSQSVDQRTAFPVVNPWDVITQATNTSNYVGVRVAVRLRIGSGCMRLVPNVKAHEPHALQEWQQRANEEDEETRYGVHLL